MPISSGGKAARLHLVGAGGKSSRRSYWPNASEKTNKSQSTSALQSIVINDRAGGPSSSSPSIENLSQGPARSTKHQQAIHQPDGAMSGTNKHRQERTATVEKFRQIRHISPPSSHATTSPTAFKYFTGGEENNNNNNHDLSGELDNQQVDKHAKKLRVKKSKADRQMSGGGGGKVGSFHSLGGQLIMTGGGQHEPPGGSTRTDNPLHVRSLHEQMQPPPPSKTRASGESKTATKSGGLFSSLMMLGGNSANQKANAHSGHHHHHNQHRQQQHTGKRLGNIQLIGGGGGGTTTINQAHNNSQTSLNPSLSFTAGQGSSSSTSSLTAVSGNSAANLHSLSSLHGLTPNLATSSTTIKRGINLKYVKTLIIILMSLDLLVTLFVHHFASNDEFALIFTRHKLRFSLVNLVLSAIWFVVLISAILFDIYAILLIGALVDIASFILLLVCSVIHFTHRIDYNSVNLTSLLLLLFSIIVLHVYLLVIAALTIYLMMAVKKRQRGKR